MFDVVISAIETFTKVCILLTKTTAAQTEDALSYYTVRGLYFLAVVFVATIVVNVGEQLLLWLWLNFLVIANLL